MNTCPCCKKYHDGLCSIVSDIAFIVNGIDEISGPSDEISGGDRLRNIVKLLVKSNNAINHTMVLIYRNVPNKQVKLLIKMNVMMTKKLMLAVGIIMMLRLQQITMYLMPKKEVIRMFPPTL